MKQLSPAISNLIANQYGNEPVNIVEVQWVVDGNWYVYGDKKIDNYEFPVDGVIQQLSTLETVIKLDSQGQSTGIDITLSDHKGDLKNIINNNDIHDRIVRVYQWFEGLPLSERFLLYEGAITSPISWSEGDRTLSFSAITQLADKEVGFSPEEGNFPFLPDDLIGVPWPLIFGKVQNVPAVRLFDVPATQTAQDLNVTDPSIRPHLKDLQLQQENLIALRNALAIQRQQEDLVCQGLQPPNPGQTPEQSCQLVDILDGEIDKIEQILFQIAQEIATLQSELAFQDNAQNDTLTVIDGSAFPQGEDILIEIGTVTLNGRFNGNVFTITGRSLADYNWESGDDPYGFTFISAGTSIKIKTEQPLIYIVNINPCTVLTVQAYRRIENEDVLVVIPANWYEVKNTDVGGGYNITYLELSIPLSSRDETLQDDIYVTCESDIGPNTVDEMEYLINKYTDLSIDSTTFDAVKLKVENYPSHFALLERKNIFELLEDMAFQSRCAIWISNRTFFLRYLPDDTVESDTINESDIDAGSLILNTTDTEELVTRLVATWTDDYAQDDLNRLILRHNIKKYGTKEREINFYIYNLPILVLKSATFWLIRFSNVWKNIAFKTYLHKFPVEAFDIVKFNFAQDFVANTDVKGMVTSVIYDSVEQTLNMEAWLPVKFGTMDVYIYSWPGQIDPSNLFPTEEEILIGYAGGDGPGAETEGGFALDDDEKSQIGYVSIQERRDRGIRDHRQDYGDEKPSDIDDTKPEPIFFGTEFVAGEDPNRQYDYNDYPYEYSPEEEDIVSNVWPGKTVEITDDGEDEENPLNPDRNLYEVDVYKNGLDEDPERFTVRQLQISDDTDNEIPADTWILVAGNPVDKPNGGPITDGIEYTMQVPVWL